MNNNEEDELDDGTKLLENKIEEDLSANTNMSLQDKIKNFVKTFGLSLPKFFRTQENETTNGFIPISILTIKKKE